MYQKFNNYCNTCADVKNMMLHLPTIPASHGGLPTAEPILACIGWPWTTIQYLVCLTWLSCCRFLKLMARYSCVHWCWMCLQQGTPRPVPHLKSPFGAVNACSHVPQGLKPYGVCAGWGYHGCYQDSWGQEWSRWYWARGWVVNSSSVEIHIFCDISAFIPVISIIPTNPMTCSHDNLCPCRQVRIDLKFSAGDPWQRECGTGSHFKYCSSSVYRSSFPSILATNSILLVMELLINSSIHSSVTDFSQFQSMSIENYIWKRIQDTQGRICGQSDGWQGLLFWCLISSIIHQILDQN